MKTVFVVVGTYVYGPFADKYAAQLFIDKHKNNFFGLEMVIIDTAKAIDPWPKSE